MYPEYKCVGVYKSRNPGLTEPLVNVKVHFNAVFSNIEVLDSLDLDSGPYLRSVQGCFRLNFTVSTFLG